MSGDLGPAASVHQDRGGTDPPSAVVLGRTALAAPSWSPALQVPGVAWKQPGTGARWSCSPSSRWGSWVASVPGHAEQRIRAPWLTGCRRQSDHRGSGVKRSGDRRTLAGVRVLGMALGMIGVALLVGLNALDGHLDGLSVLEMLTIVAMLRRRTHPP